MFWFESGRDGFWDLFRDMRGLHDVFDRFAGLPFGAAAEFPALNVWAGEKDAVVTAEIPGLEAGDMDVSVVGDTLTLRLVMKPTELKEGETWHRRERADGQFTRTLRLPFQVDAEKVDARLIRGVLQITLPRAAVDSPKKVTVQAK
jgi:HSP20 family protein